MSGWGTRSAGERRLAATLTSDSDSTALRAAKERAAFSGGSSDSGECAVALSTQRHLRHSERRRRHPLR